MKKLFGTDGIRGEANSQLTPELAFAMGRAAGWYLGEGRRGTIIIGRDPRLSGAMLESALASGIASVGLDVRLAGVVTTPGLAWLTNHEEDAVAGAMISASHNPMEDNGLKFVNSQGLKLSDAQESEIEDIYHNRLDTLPRPTGSGVGRILRDESLVDKYCQFLTTTIEQPLDLRVLVDCANGAASVIARRVLEAAGARVDVIHADPDGININRGCGSTHPETIAAAIRQGSYDLGLALDGDADRLIAVDAQGNIIDGDKIMLICARDLQERGMLHQNTLVVTVMSNLGLQLAARELGIKTVATKVGDRYVLEEMLRNGFSLGGEQSGHIIFRRFATTGDGILSALQLMQVMVRTGQSLAQLATVMEYLPQVLHNVRVASKEGWQDNKAIAVAIGQAEAQLQGQGRVLVRPSGTEPLIRVMLEGPDKAELEALARDIAQVIEKELG